ncbi:cell division ATP-binding protein FtsE [Bittarella massiliensis (ex Durand et al. 2017)]|uniref:cell division ATP-binding protein FtsE n=1 Tax=Bittarella massiliensis (ex Durand et al. 2017) TaxID=1720313 RepID=UPI001AA0BE3B|nr:cell division ATP-binding protein FtsE [Bittarella massiliensis (ex Durand et al. 2017)]MBO1680704.1 cell division ATP-binding protein FtsE [Bittarella massiliensis (ex Durand et al. 2017)]
MIEFKNVSKVYPNGTYGLKDVSVRIDDGEFVFVLGASGAGKSTFLKLIMHEEKVTSGELVVNGFSLAGLKQREVPKLRRSMGIVFQDFRLIPSMNVYDNVAFALRVTDTPYREIRKRVPFVLDLVGLIHKAKNMPNELSGGEQQRVALARALVNKPALIIADEPTGNIDPEMSMEIVDMLDSINKVGTTILMVTHEHELIRRYDHRVITIEGGSILSDQPDWRDAR